MYDIEKYDKKMIQDQQVTVRLKQAFETFKDKIHPYLSSFKCVLAYVIEFNGKIAQLCIVFQPFNVSEQYTELFYEPKMKIKIYIERLDVGNFFNLLNQFISKGYIVLNNTHKEFICSPNNILPSSIQLLEREHVKVLGRFWFSLGIKAYCTETLDKICSTFDFNKFNLIIKESKGVENLQELIENLVQLPYLKIDANHRPSLVILAPIYARIKRFGIDKDKILFYVETTKALINNSYLYVNILKISSKSQPSSLKLNLNKMKRILTTKQGLCVLSYKMPHEDLERVNLDLKSHDNFSISSGIMDINRIKDLKRKAKHLSYRYITTLLKKSINLSYVIALLISFILCIYAILFYINNKQFPDPMTAVTVAMAVATAFMAYTSKKGQDFLQVEKLKPLAEEALDKFLNFLKQHIKWMIQNVNNDEAVNIDPNLLEPEPHLVKVTYEEEPSLLRKLSKLLNTVITYNTSIDSKDIKKLIINAEDVLRSINSLEIKLSKRYWIGTQEKEKFGSVIM